MEKDYNDMSDTDLEELLQKQKNKLEDTEDELEIINGQSQSWTLPPPVDTVKRLLHS
jgi:hypothetical protein